MTKKNIIFLDLEFSEELNKINIISILRKIENIFWVTFSKTLSFLNFHLQPFLLKHFFFARCIGLKF